MNKNELTERIRLSFSDQRPADAIYRVKTAVADYLQQTDPAAAILRTEYFNHSFAPDLVLTWSRDNTARYVYLRANNDPAWLKDDIANIGSRHPLVMTLGEAQEGAPMQEVSASARQQDTLVTEPGTIEALSQARHDRPVAGLLGSALLQGGRGVITETSVGEAIETTASGFEAAESVTREPTQQAATLLADILDNRQSERLTRVLRSVWEGNGGTASDFPAATDIAAQMTGTDLRYLLDSVGSQDEGFWRRIGRNLSLDLLTRVPPTDMPRTFQYLVNANVRSLIAKAIRVAQTETRLGDEQDIFEWFVSEGNLALRASNFTAYIATAVDNLPSVERRDGPSIPALRQRAQAEGLNLGRVKVATQRASITYEAVVDANLIGDKDFTNVSGALGAATRVTEATVMLDGKRLICDFVESTARGHTNATFPVSDLARVAIPLMQSVDEPTRQRLTDLAPEIVIGPDGGEQLQLFSSEAEETKTSNPHGTWGVPEN